MSSDPGDLFSDRERARALIDLRRFDEACSLLRTVVGRDPADADAWCLLSQAEGGARRPHDALEAASRASALTPEDDWPHRLRSVALQMLGAHDSAIAAAREGLRAGPWTWQAHVRLSNALVAAKGDLDEALAEAELGVELGPHEPATYYSLGLVYERRGRREDAVRCYEEALAIDPEDSASLDGLARVRFAGSRLNPGGLAGAATGFRDAVRADPRSPHSARNLEIVIGVFLSRLSYLIFVILWLASRDTGGTVGDRVWPLLLLLIPAGFAVWFLVNLTPDLRRHVLYISFHGRLAAPMIAQCCAVALLCVGAAVPHGARAPFGIGALLISIAARILLARRTGARWFPWFRWFKRRRA